MTTLRDTALRAAAVVIGGFALRLAYPRMDWEGLAWVALVPLLVVAVQSVPRLAFVWGWLGGFVFFVSLLHWLDFTFRTYSHIPWPLTWAPTAALAGYCALWIGLPMVGVAWITRRLGAVLALAAAPFLWVAGEFVRGHLFSGFPWDLLGYSQYRTLDVIQIAELGGVYAVSFVVLAVNAAIAGCVVLPWRRALPGVAAGAVLLGGTLTFGGLRLAELGRVAPAGAEHVTVAVMQPSIPQPLKWDERYTVETLRVYFALTRAAVEAHPDLLVWPETASPTILRQDPVLLGALRQLSAESGVPLLVGSVDVEGTPPRYRNTAFLLTGQGLVGRYDKIHLVPFGEYVPLSGVIGFVRGWADFISELEPGSRAVVFPGPPAPFGVVICYEGIFPALVRDFVEGGARLIVNMTNDAWFGHTSGPLQHLAMYPLRAVEHRTAVVRAANTGVSAFIDPSGRIVRSLPLYARGALTMRVPLRRVETLYTRFGDWLAYLALVVTGVFALILVAGGRHAR